MSPHGQDVEEFLTSEAATTTTTTNNNSTTDVDINTSSSGAAPTALRATRAMCYHCFDVLIEELKVVESPSSRRSRGAGRPYVLRGGNHNAHVTRNSNDDDNNPPQQQQQQPKRSFRTVPSVVSTASSTGSSNHPIQQQEEQQQQQRPLFVQSLPNFDVECPIFVTWEKQKRSNSNNSNNSKRGKYELRGCIGTLGPKPVITSIGEYAILSAFRDKRFDAVTIQELTMLRVGVSLLVEYEDCEHCYDWIVGIHGIIIRFDPKNFVATANSNNKKEIIVSNKHTKSGSSNSNNNQELSATFLPEVAPQQNWDQAKTVSSLIRKAGYHGNITERLLQHVHCTRYQSSKEKVAFDDYLQQLDEGTREELLQDILLRGDSSKDDYYESSSQHHHGANHNNCQVM